MFKLSVLLASVSIFFSCHYTPKPSVKKVYWGMENNKEVFLYTLTNIHGMEVKITNYAGSVTSILVPDKSGKFENVALGFDSLKRYRDESLSALIGRFANRIAYGKFTLDGKEYTLARNNMPHHLHGGVKGFHKVVWDGRELPGKDSVGLELTYVSKDMEEGYPGTLTAKVTYVLTNKNELKLYYQAESDKPTVVNLTSHLYFNLTACKEDVLNHELTLNADSITVFDSTAIPTGVIAPVAHTVFDFTKGHRVGDSIAKVGVGYDQNFKLNKRKDSELTFTAEVYEPNSGRLLQMYTTEPGIQLYTGNWLSNQLVNERGVPLRRHYGLCLEAQHFPDSPNRPSFPSVILRPGQKYFQLTIYKFSVR